MSVITVAAVQAAPLSVTGLPIFGRHDTVAAFAADVRSVRSQISGPALLVYPEFHLFGTEDSPAQECDRLLRAAAEPLDSDLMAGLAEIARDDGAWLIPGSVCELGTNGEVFNTAVVFSPTGPWPAPTARSFLGDHMSGPRPVTKWSPSTCRRSGGSDCPSVTTHGSRKSVGTWPGWAPNSSSTSSRRQPGSAPRTRPGTRQLHCQPSLYGEREHRRPGRARMQHRRRPRRRGPSGNRGRDRRCYVSNPGSGKCAACARGRHGGDQPHVGAIPSHRSTVELPLYAGRIDPHRWARSRQFDDTRTYQGMRNARTGLQKRFWGSAPRGAAEQDRRDPHVLSEPICPSTLSDPRPSTGSALTAGYATFSTSPTAPPGTALTAGSH